MRPVATQKERTSRLMTCAIAIIMLASRCLPLSAGDAELARFKAEYPEASRIITERLSQVRGKGRLITTDYETGRVSPPGEFEFRVDHGFQKAFTTGIGRQERGKHGAIYCWGDEVGFILVRRADNANLTVEARGNEGWGRRHHDRAIGRYLCSPYSIVLMKPLAGRLNPPFASDLSVEPVAIDGRPALRLHHLLTGKGKGSVTVDLAPDLGWVILAATVRDGVGRGYSYRAQYAPDRRHWPLPVSVEFKELDLDITRCEFRSVEFAPTPPEEFAMSYYGLPDIPGMPTSPVADSASPLSATPTGRSWWRNPLFFGFIALALVGFVSARLLRSAALRTKRGEQISSS